MATCCSVNIGVSINPDSSSWLRSLDGNCLRSWAILQGSAHITSVKLSVFLAINQQMVVTQLCFCFDEFIERGRLPYKKQFVMCAY